MTLMPVVVIASLVGAVIGSFLNVCIYRLPRHESVVWPASHCTTCGSLIAFYDNIPMISYGILRGRCRTCRVSISIQYPLVELVTSIGYGLIFWHFGLTAVSFVYALLYSALIVITGTDLSHQVIPDVITLPGLAIGILSAAIILPLGIMNSVARGRRRWRSFVAVGMGKPVSFRKGRHGRRRYQTHGDGWRIPWLETSVVGDHGWLIDWIHRRRESHSASGHAAGRVSSFRSLSGSGFSRRPFSSSTGIELVLELV